MATAHFLTFLPKKRKRRPKKIKIRVENRVFFGKKYGEVADMQILMGYSAYGKRACRNKPSASSEFLLAAFIRHANIFFSFCQCYRIRVLGLLWLMSL